MRIKENGPVRVSHRSVARDRRFEVRPDHQPLGWRRRAIAWSLPTSIDWRTLAANLKETFALSASNPNATYNWEVGTIQRPNAHERQFEVASHRWIDLTDKDGSFGVTILTDCKNGSDKPNDNTMRLTLLRRRALCREWSPGAVHRSGKHGLGSPRDSSSRSRATQETGARPQTDWQGYRLNDPLIAFKTTRHAGALGKTFSLLKVEQLADSRLRAQEG